MLNSIRLVLGPEKRTHIVCLSNHHRIIDLLIEFFFLISTLEFYRVTNQY